MHLSCGSIARRVACPALLHANADTYWSPDPGDYFWMRANGQVDQPGDLRLIESWAVESITGPDPSSPWITTSAGPAPSSCPTICQ
jgi:hypothetical protein